MANYTYTAKDVIGLEVKNYNDEVLGKVEDVAIYPRGNIAYFILSHGGIMGTSLNAEQFAIPYELLSWDEMSNCLRLGISYDFLDNITGFDDHTRPDFPDIRFREMVRG